MPLPDNGFQRMLQITDKPRRVVSLVPSLTESMFDLDLGSNVVGITDYCVHPEQALISLPRLGGPKDPRTGDIVALEPDLVLANREENSRQVIEALESAGLNVWVTFPKTIREALDVLWVMVGIYKSVPAAVKLETLELTLDWVKTAAEGKPTLRTFCPIWTDRTEKGQPWWMTFNHDTYCHAVLEAMGAVNIFSSRERRYPLNADLGAIPPKPAGDRDTRYPRVTLNEVVDGDPEIILLPSEPYPFEEALRDELLVLLADTTAVKTGRVHQVDGSLITWHGTLLARALRELPNLLFGVGIND